MRTRVLALFLLALPLCNFIGSPISAHILLMDQVHGLKGWQWLFLIEGTPALLLGVLTWFVLADGPWSAAWLSAHEKEELNRAIRSEEQAALTKTRRSWPQVLRDSIAYFLWSTGMYGLSFFLPKVLVSTGASMLATGWWSALAFGAGALALLWASLQRGHRALPFLFMAAAAGFAFAGLSHSVPAAVASFCLAAMGLLASLPIFWSVSASRLSGKAAGAAIAIVNSAGAVGAFAGPYAMGWLRDATHSYSAGLWAIAACLAVGSGFTINPSEIREITS
jgi:predicted MFS family arabinose efflux permease